jgi:hypothetical protein
MDRKGLFAEKLPGANKFLFGAPETTLAEASLARTPTTVGETTGILGSGGKMFQFGGEKGVMDQIKGFRDQTKLGDLLLGGKEAGTFSKSKIAGLGIGTLSLIQNANTPREAGIALASATGDADDRARGEELFSQLTPELFAIPERFRLPVPAANGGLMRTNYAMGPDERGVVNPFKPKPQGPVLPDEDKPFTPKPTPSKMAFDLKEYQKEFESVFPDMIEKRGTDEYNDALEDYFRGLASKDKEGIMMASSKTYMDYVRAAVELGLKPIRIDEFESLTPIMDVNEILKVTDDLNKRSNKATGGRANLALGTKPTTEESGLGGLPIEADMRYTGGFMPYGAVEKADDVPARLSKNEFVFTADAVRAAGGGSVNEGAKKMYQAMKQLEKKPEAKGMMA